MSFPPYAVGLGRFPSTRIDEIQSHYNRSFSARAQMDPKARKPKLPPRASERPRRILMRATLQQAREVCDSELRHLASLSQATDSAEAYALVKSIAPSAPTTLAWGHLLLPAVSDRISQRSCCV